MTAESIQEAARRNRAKRLEAVARLRPLIPQAKQKQEEAREIRENAVGKAAELRTVAQFKHIPNFFPTPRRLVLRMIERAELFEGANILEPSAGKGNIAKELTGYPLTCIERAYSLVEYLKGHGILCECADFLTVEPTPQFDRVLMNPPFERGQDEKHVRHALRFLKPGGRLVAIVSTTTAKRLEDIEGMDVERLPSDTFAKSERSTNVQTCLIIIIG